MKKPLWAFSFCAIRPEGGRIDGQACLDRYADMRWAAVLRAGGTHLARTDAETARDAVPI